MELNLTILDNADLEISFDESDREEIEEMKDGKTDLDILWEGTEHYWTNGGYQPFDSSLANPFVGLTSAPCIAESFHFDDDGNATIEGNFWFYEGYMLMSFIDEMLKNGKVIFTLAT